MLDGLLVCSLQVRLLSTVHVSGCRHVLSPQTGYVQSSAEGWSAKPRQTLSCSPVNAKVDMLMERVDEVQRSVA